MARITKAEMQKIIDRHYKEIVKQGKVISKQRETIKWFQEKSNATQDEIDAAISKAIDSYVVAKERLENEYPEGPRQIKELEQEVTRLNRNLDAFITFREEILSTHTSMINTILDTL